MRPSNIASILSSIQRKAKDDILKAPVLESPVPASWIAYLQSVTANGNKLTGHSAWVDTYVQQLNISIPSDNTIAIFDTGTSLSAFPRLLRQG